MATLPGNIDSTTQLFQNIGVKDQVIKIQKAVNRIGEEEDIIEQGRSANRIADTQELQENADETFNEINKLVTELSKNNDAITDLMNEKKKEIEREMNKDPGYLNKLIQTFDENINNGTILNSSIFTLIIFKKKVLPQIQAEFNGINTVDRDNDNYYIKNLKETIRNLKGHLIELNKNLETKIAEAENKGIRYKFLNWYYQGGKKKGKKSTRKKYKMTGGAGIPWLWIWCITVTHGICIIAPVVLLFGGLIYAVIKYKGDDNDETRDANRIEDNDTAGGTKKHKRIIRRKRNTRRKIKFLKLNRKISKNMRRK